jgi:hypothetical protein
LNPPLSLFSPGPPQGLCFFTCWVVTLLCVRGILWRCCIQLVLYKVWFINLLIVCSTLCRAAGQSSWCGPGHKSLRRTFTLRPAYNMRSHSLTTKVIYYLEIKNHVFFVHTPHTPHMALALHCQKEMNFLLGGY